MAWQQQQQQQHRELKINPPLRPSFASAPACTPSSLLRRSAREIYGGGRFAQRGRRCRGTRSHRKRAAAHCPPPPSSSSSRAPPWKKELRRAALKSARMTRRRGTLTGSCMASRAPTAMGFLRGPAAGGKDWWARLLWRTAWREPPAASVQKARVAGGVVALPLLQRCLGSWATDTGRSACFICKCPCQW